MFSDGLQQIHSGIDVGQTTFATRKVNEPQNSAGPSPDHSREQVLDGRNRARVLSGESLFLPVGSDSLDREVRVKKFWVTKCADSTGFYAQLSIGFEGKIECERMIV